MPNGENYANAALTTKNTIDSVCLEKKHNIGLLGEKSYAFAVRTIKAYKFLLEQKVYIISKQFLRAGTAIGANCREAIYAQSKADFVNKLSIALKEASETAYWLELLHDTGYINDTSFNSIYADCTEIIKLMTSIILTTKTKYHLKDS
jgi:four helix bundle protein